MLGDPNPPPPPVRPDRSVGLPLVVLSYTVTMGLFTDENILVRSICVGLQKVLFACSHLIPLEGTTAFRTLGSANVPQR
jgi:hypothetical protein